MRTIKFKAKRVDTGEWISGNVFIPEKFLAGVYICPNTNYGDFAPNYEDGEDINEAMKDGCAIGMFIEVDPETVCQFVCTQDGVDYWEGDIVENADGDERVIAWAFYGFELRLLNGDKASTGVIWHFHLNQTGKNIHDNPTQP